MSTVDWPIRDGLHVFSMREFITGMSGALPPLIDFLCGPQVRFHPTWGKLIPYDVLPYGEGRSLGHCVRPDIILTTEGLKVCELDFVPAGRGFALNSIPDQERRQRYLGVFGEWYRKLGFTKVLYAITSAIENSYGVEVEIFCRALRQEQGIEISLCNADFLESNESALVDRLFYSAELSDPSQFYAPEVMTKEPFLDSKMIFALVHDESMEGDLLKALGPDSLAFLRAVLPETYALDTLRERDREFLAQAVERRRSWVIKNTDVETNECWGSRGVLLGSRRNGTAFRAAAFANESPHNKNIGAHPILQKFHQSVDFKPVWDAVVEGMVAQSTSQEMFGMTQNPAVVGVGAKNHVYARIGIYCLVVNATKEVIVPDVGVLTLRQDPMAHGASDALFTAFEIV